MAVRGVDQVGEGPLDELVQNAAQQAVVLAREQLDVARRELTARAKRAGPGVAMVGGGAVLGALASGTGTAALVLGLARRRGAAAAALVTGAYAGAGALLAREGLVRLREAVPEVPDDAVEREPAESAKRGSGSARRRTDSAAKSARATKSAATSRLQSPAGVKPGSKTTSPRRRASGTHAAERSRGRRS